VDRALHPPQRRTTTRSIHVRNRSTRIQPVTWTASPRPRSQTGSPLTGNHKRCRRLRRIRSTLLSCHLLTGCSTLRSTIRLFLRSGHNLLRSHTCNIARGLCYTHPHNRRAPAGRRQPTLMG
jgi:hypothetical protein